MYFYSQAMQDNWVCEVLNYKPNGFYIDIGGYDGVTTSNTYAFETQLGWTGICVEPNTDLYSMMRKNRRNNCINAAISDYNGICHFGNDRIVENSNTFVNCYTLDQLLINNSAPREIDYLSIDIEGDEHKVLSNFNFKNWDIKLMTVEHNFYLAGDTEKNKLFELLTAKGFIRVVNNVVCSDSGFRPFEDWYVNSKYFNYLRPNIEKWNSTHYKAQATNI
jgi:FkbM family methyltransferase